MFYTDYLFSYHRRQTWETKVGEIGIGGANPIRIQSMTNVNTMDTQSCVEQCIRMIEAGSELVRITTPGIAEAENLKNIQHGLRQKGYRVPLIADVHFNPRVAETAAQIVEKVRINPGNYVDKKQFKQLQYTDHEYALEIERIADRLVPLLKICQANGTAIRIGTNHGSLCDRIVSRYGNTPLGMAISTMEFVSICHDFGFYNLVLSMKSSDTRIMVQSVRYLVSMLNEKQWHYPLHLGVTEAGDGEYGRIKSAAGIACLLQDGIGDTIRVSLTEKPENELAFADILAHLNDNTPSASKTATATIHYNPYQYQKRNTQACGKIGGDHRPVIVSEDEHIQDCDLHPQDLPAADIIIAEDKDNNITALRTLADTGEKPLLLKKTYTETDWEKFYAHATADVAVLGMDGLLDGIWIQNPHFSSQRIYELCLNILQACGLRYSRAEFISCPSCGRTQYAIEQVVSQVKAATAHLCGLKIGIMGCIVNGPGEMADADYGVVGSGRGVVTLYKGHTPLKRNIPQEQAAEELVLLIKNEGKWMEP
ncbi:MAG: (E)-4-hydroxy-3-methylbut-2-enyl-diphosphate synthase [Bacteroidales bacterium]|nr:(E)-4-hydroxy-3-methylbut-2-enyl-diphosphate synthase [Bacteroidales bacterium]